MSEHETDAVQVEALQAMMSLSVSLDAVRDMVAAQFPAIGEYQEVTQ